MPASATTTPRGRRTTFHGLRASTATLLARAGVARAIAMLVLRHSDPRLTLRTYAKLNGDHVRAELLAKLTPPRIASTPASTCSVPERAAVGCSVPLAESGTAIARRVEASREARVVPELADSCRSVPEAEASGESGGRCRSRTCDPQLVDRPRSEVLDVRERCRNGRFSAVLEKCSEPSGT